MALFHVDKPISELFDSKLMDLICWIAGAAMGIAIVVVMYGGKKTNFNDATLAVGTTTVRASINGQKIHCEDSRDADLCISGARARSAQHIVLWLGNSQLHAINQYREGGRNAVPMLHETLAGHGLDVIGFSEPNANLQEHSVVFASLMNSLPIKTLILPVVFDDMREDGVREDLLAMLHHPEVKRSISRYSIGEHMMAANKLQSSEFDTGAIRQTLQENAELNLTQWLNSNSSFWLARSEARGNLFVALYELRNAVFQIKPHTARRIIPSRYRSNIEALRMILDLAKKSKVRVITYVAPIRNDVPIPYIADQYLSFKNEVYSLASEHGAIFLNLESIVPAQYWGTKASTSIGIDEEIDYMHFQEPGHQVLADSIGAAVLSMNNQKEAVK